MCVDRTITEVSFNWGWNELGEWCSRYTVGKEYPETDEVNELEFIPGAGTINLGLCKEGMPMTKCTLIEEHNAKGEGDKWYYDVHFENGKIVRIFNPNTVEYKR